MTQGQSVARIAVGADGSGSTFRHIVEAYRTGALPARVAVHFTCKRICGARDVADEFDIPSVVVSSSESLRNTQLRNLFREMIPRIDLICLAGFLKRISPLLCEEYQGRILNSHPALDMIRFGGEGMYGANVTRAELEAGVTETGSSIHYVTRDVDGGEVIATSRVRVEPGDTPESLLARKLPAERRLYVQAIAQVLGEQEPAGIR